ncbi:hypothetical protein NGB36_20090 [Streptomyces sp. RB6PN25]|uniref:Uncharacterized protein n=1 Tax=Streptomyces humicola TaxID=2953240 RepID=A0ABT1Q0M0_9ACTN|nr:hypothetical protein [Streptomyces humicola]MCQ4082840.1 hypothetical protein [Streptomyces humicola]
MDAPASPLRTAGPALGLGDPLKFRSKETGDAQLGWLESGKSDPRLVTAPVSAVPGATAKLSPENHPVSLPRTLTNGLATTKAMSEALPGALSSASGASSA